MKTSIKSVISLTLCNLLMCVSAAYSQSTADATFEPNFPLPPAELRPYFGATVRYAFKGIKFAGIHKKMGGKFNDNLYEGSYLFPYFPNDGPYVPYNTITIFIIPGYSAEVCNEYRNDCVTYDRGLHEYPGVGPVWVRIYKRRFMPNEVVLWYKTTPKVAITATDNRIWRSPQDDFALNPYTVWVPPGYWIRLCKSETPKSGECETHTRDNNLSGPYKIIEVGKGDPPIEPKPKIEIIKPEFDTKQLKYPPPKVPKPKALPKAKPQSKRLP